MKILIWHVHGSWLTSFVAGPDQYRLPVIAGRGPDGRGRARTWTWPPSAAEVAPARLAADGFDVAVLQRPHEIDLLRRWTGLRAGTDVPAVYGEHNAPPGPAAASRHPLADRNDIPIVHVTAFNALMWDCGAAPTVVIEHGIADPGYRNTGDRRRVAAVVNEPVRRWRVAGTDVLLRLADRFPIEVYGMGMAALAVQAPLLADHLHDDIPQADLPDLLGHDRAYLHPYRWTSLGLALAEAMTLGMPVLALATTAAPESVPAAGRVLSNDRDLLTSTAHRWLADPAEAKERGLAARRHALAHFGIDGFLDDWQHLLKEVTR